MRRRFETNDAKLNLDREFVTLLREFLFAFELVFDHDWEYSLAGLSDEFRELYISKDGTFLSPDVGDESGNWANRGALIYSYRKLKNFVAENFHDEEKKYEAGLTKFHYETPVLPWKEQHDRFMRNYLKFVIDSVGGNISAASRVLKVYRPCLYKMMKRCGLGLDLEPVESKKMKAQDLLEISNEDLLHVLKPDELRTMADQMHKLVEGFTTNTARESLEGIAK